MDFSNRQNGRVGYLPHRQESCRLGFSPQHQQVLEELEKTQKDFWNISRQTANFLNMLIKISGAKNVLEIGTSNGYSGIWLAQALKQTGGHLTTIEFYEKRIVLARENFKKCGVDDIITIKQGSACEVLEQLDEIFDFVFIDANKGEYIKYFELIDPKLKNGGIIAADNITSHAEKVAPFVEKIKSDPNYQVEILDLPTGLLLGYKY
ncbi:MAG: O-methyltransferase [Candidatus Gastranaerophilales bacterium]|nr:O-methyltransferase [Candidatus Gastranaerophilales bacterium]